MMQRFLPVSAGYLLLLVALAAGLACSKSEPARASEAASEPATPSTAIFEVAVTENGYTPSSVNAAPGVPIVLRFTRTTDKGCGQKVVLPSREITKELPLNQPVDVALTPKAGESIVFTCGMGMYKGAVVVASN